MQPSEMNRTPDDDPKVARFLAELEAINWFSNIGRPLPEGADIKTISGWNEWLGPEEPSIAELNSRQQALYVELMKDESSWQLAELWDRIHGIVFRSAKPKVPYDDERDTWHAPNSAVWHAAWTAGLMGLCIYLRQSVPSELAKQWKWFIEEHWPCDWEGTDADGDPIVF